MNFEALLTRSPNPYVLVDRNLTIVWMNEAYLTVTMRERKDIVNRSIFEAFPSDEASEGHVLLRSSFERVLKTRQTDEIALIRYDIAGPQGAMEHRYWSATHTPQLDDRGEVKFILQHTVDVTELHSLRRMRDQNGLVGRAKAVQARNFDLVKEAEWLKDIFDQAPGFTAILNGPDHRFVIANRAFRDLTGRENLLGEPLAGVLPDLAAQGLVAQLDKVTETRSPYLGQSVPFDILAEARDTVDTRILDVIYQPICKPDGSVTGIFVQGHDVTAKVEALAVQRALIEELNHRVKNNLAVVQGLATQTFRSVPGGQDARAALDGRLRALAAAHDALATVSWGPVAFERLVSRVIAGVLTAEAQERVLVEGPLVSIPAQRAASLALVLNELATNALQHGSLSADGSVHLQWSIEGPPENLTVTLEWLEANGPVSAKPARNGFGTKLLRGLVMADGGSADLNFTPEGFRYKAVVTLA